MTRPPRYLIDPARSRFTAQAFAGGALSAMGHNPTFIIRDVRGEVEFDPETPGSSSLRVSVGAASLELTGNVSDKDRQEIEQTTRNDVLESGKYAEITYQCPASRVTAIGPMQLTLAGDLTLHGTTKGQPVSARVYLVGDTLRCQGEATVRQSEYGIRPVSVAGGMLKVKDEVKLTFEIMARRAPDRQGQDRDGGSGAASAEGEAEPATAPAR